MITSNTAKSEVMSRLKSEPPACRRFFSWGHCEGFFMNQDRLKELLHYCPETGVFTRRTSCGRYRAGTTVGTKPSGTLKYVSIYVANQRFLAQRLAWLYVYGELPTTDLDHINRIKTDNRIENLRQVTRSQNMQNVWLHKHNTSGHKGISWTARLKKWRVYVFLQRKQIHIGVFADFDDAVAAYRAAAAQHHTHNPAAQT